MANRHKLHRRQGAQANRSVYSGAGSHAAAEAKGTDHAGGATVAHHHVVVGLVVGNSGAGRADRAPRVQGHRGRTHQDSSLAKLPDHDLNGNRPASELLSRKSHGNIASGPRGKDRWEYYASSRSVTREHRHASNSSTSTSKARHHGATDHLVDDISGGKPCNDISDGQLSDLE